MRQQAPPANRSFLNVQTITALKAEECDAIASSVDDGSWVSARVSRHDDPYGAIDPASRSVLSQPLAINENGWPALAIVNAINSMNATTWRFDLWGFSHTDQPSVLLYQAQVNDHFRPHLDAGEQNPTRKLSFSLQLSDPSSYRGGDLLFGGSHPPESRAQGALTVFPSILMHEVTPVYTGKRLAIVGWIHGPTFR